MKEIEVQAKTIEEAIEIALKELGVQRDDVEIKILKEEKKGLFGMEGSNKAKVKVTIKGKK